jgi:hypothetical protein
MSKGKGQHVVPHEGQWAVKGEGNSRATVVTPTQEQAIDKGREIARHQHSELFIHDRGGRIRERDSHGHDSPKRKG